MQLFSTRSLVLIASSGWRVTFQVRSANSAGPRVLLVWRHVSCWTNPVVLSCRTGRFLPCACRLYRGIRRKRHKRQMDRGRGATMLILAGAFKEQVEPHRFVVFPGHSQDLPIRAEGRPSVSRVDPDEEVKKGVRPPISARFPARALGRLQTRELPPRARPGVTQQHCDKEHLRADVDEEVDYLHQSFRNAKRQYAREHRPHDVGDLVGHP